MSHACQGTPPLLLPHVAPGPMPPPLPLFSCCIEPHECHAPRLPLLKPVVQGTHGLPRPSMTPFCPPMLAEHHHHCRSCAESQSSLPSSVSTTYRVIPFDWSTPTHPSPHRQVVGHAKSAAVHWRTLTTPPTATTSSTLDLQGELHCPTPCPTHSPWTQGTLATDDRAFASHRGHESAWPVFLRGLGQPF
jgi:hypothetical protein